MTGSGRRPDAPDLADLLAVVADEHATADPQALARHDLGGAVEYLAHGRPFATGSSAWAEFRLRPDVAAAALRTPDVSLSDRGAEWVRFTPPSLDRYALDRVTAWFEFARRHVAD